MHALAKKHQLGHKSQGSDKAGTRFLTVFKKGVTTRLSPCPDPNPHPDPNPNLTPNPNPNPNPNPGSNPSLHPHPHPKPKPTPAGGGGGGGRQVEEAEVVEHYERIQNLGYSHHNRGVGLGFGGMHAAAPPASLLRQCAQVVDRLTLTQPLTDTVSVA